VTPTFFGIPALTVAGWMAAAVGAVLLVLLVLAAFNRILLKMALRNIPRRRAQTVLILFGLMLATTIITASLAVGDTLSYSLVAIQLPQMGGIDEAFTRHADRTVQGASTTDSDFFSPAQAADVMARSKADPDIAAVVGVIVAQGSMVDSTTNQSVSNNVAVFGVPPDFSSVWGRLRSRSGTDLDVGGLGSTEVLIGKSLGDRLNAHGGDTLQLFVDGHPAVVTIRDVLDTEVNPSIAAHGPLVNSVLMPLDAMRSIEHRPGGSNLILLHNHGSGGLDDLGPGGGTGSAITRRLRSAFMDPRAATELKDYLNTPILKTQLVAIRDTSSFLDPSKELARRMLVEMAQPSTTDEFKALAGDDFVQRMLFRAVTASVPKSASSDALSTAQDALGVMLASLQVDSGAAAELKALLARPDVRDPLEQLAASLPASNPASATITSLLAEIARADVSPKFRSMAGNPGLQKELAVAIGAIAPNELAQFNDIAGRLDLYQYSAYKADAVIFGQVGGQFITGALLGVSFFSIAVGVLLIFLIFVMLAAERRAEMGMSRAVGLKRRHLTQMFLFEGTAYTLGATVIGVVLGVLVGMLMMQVLSSIFSGFYKGIDLQFHVEWTSLVVSICLGILLTFIVVAFSAYRVSRLNIVAAIRDLDESEHRDEGMLSMFVAPFRVAWAGLKQLRHGHPLVFLNRITLGILGSIKTFWWALFRRGPMTIALGVLLIVSSLNSHSEIVYTAGVSLVIIGAGLLIKWILTVARVRQLVAGRAGFSAAAAGLLVYWARPFGHVEDVLHIADAVQLKKLIGGPEVFALTALMVLLGAIWLVMYNSDLLIHGVMFFTGRIGALAPITRTSMAYPMATKFRTGMAVAMFAIVTFMIVYVAVFKDVLLQNFGQPDVASGGWQVVAGSPDQSGPPTDKTFPADVASLVHSDPNVAGEIRGVGWENQSLQVQLHQVRADGTVDSRRQSDFAFNPLHAVDDGYLTTTGYALQPRAVGYGSDRAIWDAVRDHKGFAVIDASNLDSFGGNAPIVAGIKPTDASFQPFQVQVTIQGSTTGTSTPPWTLTVIGFMTRPYWSGTYVSTQTAMDSGFFAASEVSNAPPNLSPSTALRIQLRPLAPTGYYFALNRGVNVNKARLDLGRMLVKDQLEPVIVADQLALQLGSFLTLLNLVSGFLALGLIVGIAGLGVISTRAVVERWQQIGMLRALGYRRSLVQRSFLMESSLIAILGLVIGALVGMLESYRFFVTDKTFGTVEFHVPLFEIGLILVGAYVATLLTTYLPARSASRVAPAEALRYE
jgi:putative ABC transport system permease protein